MLIAIVKAHMQMRSSCGMRMCRRLLVVLAGALCLAAPAQKSAPYPKYDPYSACEQKYLSDSASVGQFNFRAYRNEEGGCLRVLRGGKEVLLLPMDNNGYYTLGQKGDPRHGIPEIPNGTDLTGRGRPDMIVSAYTGGLHCCTLIQVYELAPKLKLLATLDAEHGDLAHFALIGQQYYFVAADWTFAYWRTSFADSPAPRVVLRFDANNSGGRYHLALDKMERPAPTATEWARIEDAAHAAFGARNPLGQDIGSRLWGNMLELIYRGHSTLAWRLLNDAWPATRPGKGAFLSDFCSRLKTSPYWADLEPSLRNMPPACAQAKANRGTD